MKASRIIRTFALGAMVALPSCTGDTPKSVARSASGAGAGTGTVTAKGTAPGTGAFAQQLPDFALNDPNGKSYSSGSVSKEGVVLVVTAPTLSNADAQEGWSKFLLDAKSSSKATLVFLEDMQPSNFKGTAKSRMQERYVPGKEPVVLLDESGKTRESLKVPEETTVVLVYGKGGKLTHVESDEPSAERATAIWKRAED